MQSRPASADDVDEVAALIRRAYEKYVPRMDRPPAPMTDDYTALVGRGVVTVLTDGGDIRGVIVGWVEGDSFYIDNIAVDPDAHGGGYGSALLAVAEQQARQAGCARIWLYTNAVMTENLDYYRRRGFVEFDRRWNEGFDRVFFERHVLPQEGPAAS